MEPPSNTSLSAVCGLRYRMVWATKFSESAIFKECEKNCEQGVSVHFLVIACTTPRLAKNVVQSRGWENAPGIIRVKYTENRNTSLLIVKLKLSLNVLREKTPNHYTIVSAPLGIEPNTA